MIVPNLCPPGSPLTLNTVSFGLVIVRSFGYEGTDVLAVVVGVRFENNWPSVARYAASPLAR